MKQVEVEVKVERRFDLLHLSLNLSITLEAFPSILLVRWGKHRDDAQGAAGPTGNFHRQGDHVESPIRKIA